MNEFKELIEQRETRADGFGPWFWVKGDTGAWDGPCKDWETSHKTKYFAHLKQHRAVITAGANCGMYAHFYAQTFGVVYAFEPDYLNFHCMVNNNQLQNVIKMQAILGQSCGVAGINQFDITNVGMHTVKPDGFIPMLTIDSLNLPVLDLIQLDVEGFEYNVIKGAENTVLKHRPVIILENGRSDLINNWMFDFHYEQVDQSVSDSVWVSKIPA